MRYVALLVPGLLVAALAIPRENPPGETVTVFTNATIYTATADAPIQKGMLVVRGGKIAAVASADDAIQLPRGAKVIDLKGQTVIPGLVDTHSHIGIFSRPNVGANSDGNESSGPVQTALRALDAIDPADPGIRMATAGGITVANIMPGSANVIGGQTLYVKLRGKSVEGMRILGEVEGKPVLGGLKMANGENPKGYGKRGQAPFTRMKVYSLQREQFVKAAEYKKKLDAPKKDDPEKKDAAPDRDPSLDPLVEVLERKRTVHFHCHRADDLMSAIRIAEEFGFELVLQHASEGYRIAEVLAKKKIPCSLTIVDSPGGKAEIMGLLEENAAVLDKAGVMVAVNTDDSVTESRFFLRTGAIAMRGGMSEAAALRALTIHPAKMLHLDHRLGSLEKGKDADFVILSGAPFSVYTRVQQTWIDGKKVFDASEEADRVYRDGGMFLPRGTKVPTVEDALDRLPSVDKRNLGGDNPVNPKETWVFGQRIHIGNGKTIHNGRIVVVDGKIKSVEALDGKEPLAPVGVAVHSASDVSPGLIDAMTCAGLSGAWNIPADQDQDEGGDANQADIRVFDAFNTNEPLLEFLRSNGITVVHATPGRQTPIAGRTGVFRTGGRTVDDATLVPTFALLVNLGEAGKGRGTNTRMGLANQVRKAFADVQGKKGSGAKHEAITAALEGKLKVIFAANRADDIRTALRISEEFKLKPILALGTESWMIADELAKANIPVIVHPAMQRPAGTMETINTLLGTPAILNKAGVTITMGSSFEGYVPKNRNLRGEAAIAAVNGLGHANAMKMVTLDAAKLLGIDKTHGSIEVGKVADLVLYDGDPFEHATHVMHTFMAGKLVFDRAEYLKLPFERRILPLVSGNAGCCMFGW
jgi:imidazolonepropionase-like amidohydrolase